ncbi:MAG: ATP-binding protein [Actinobacteria bacterium]|nr:ATP-binding protein [Actinomycetota bacterium]
MDLIPRTQDFQAVSKLLATFPVTAILGPRQCGKTTLARLFKADHCFDLENPRDLARLEQPQLALEDLRGLILIDEIQRLPELFPLLRYLVDRDADQRYLILGSASRDLLRQSSETLAGRVAFHQLGGFRVSDVGPESVTALWLRGGLPRSFLASAEEESLIWRRQYISTFLERDIPQLGISIPARTMRRFWTMLSHYHGQVLNYSELARSFGVSDMTVRRYCEILEGAFMIRLLQPWAANIGKRVVRRPKLYLRDSGLLHTLLSLESLGQLQSSPVLGASWEGFALEVVGRLLDREDHEFYFWRTHAGAELDLYWQWGGRAWGVECKYQDAPRLTRSMKAAMEDLELAGLWVVYPGRTAYRLAENIWVVPVGDLGSAWAYPGGSTVP